MVCFLMAGELYSLIRVLNSSENKQSTVLRVCDFPFIYDSQQEVSCRGTEFFPVKRSVLHGNWNVLKKCTHLAFSCF